MPNLSYLSDSDVADVVTFVMNSWGNPGGRVSSGEVAAARGGEMVTGPAITRSLPREKWPTRERPVAIEGARGLSIPKARNDPGRIRSCHQVYFERCAGCHGVLRKGAPANH